MAVGLLGRKVGMTQVFDPTGQVIPVTVIQAGPCHVLQVRTETRDGYEAVQIGYLDKPRRLASRSDRGHVAKLDSKRQKRRAAAGVQPVAKAGVTVLLTGFVGAKAMRALAEAGIRVADGLGALTVREAVECLVRGEITPILPEDVASGRAAAPPDEKPS